MKKYFNFLKMEPYRENRQTKIDKCDLKKKLIHDNLTFVSRKLKQFVCLTQQINGKLN